MGHLLVFLLDGLSDILPVDTRQAANSVVMNAIGWSNDKNIDEVFYIVGDITNQINHLQKCNTVILSHLRGCIARGETKVNINELVGLLRKVGY